MTIKVYADRIEIGNKTITTIPTGIRIGDALAANTQQQGYISQANFTANDILRGAFGFQGSVSGYTSGGDLVNTVDKFSLSADTNAGDVGDLTQVREVFAGASSTTHGYACGGWMPNGSNVIDRFPFAVDTNATDAGDLTQARTASGGHSSSVFGYVSGGTIPPSPTGTVTTIDKFPFSTVQNASDVGNLVGINANHAGITGPTDGYVAGGSGHVAGQTNTIQKFSFSSDSNAIDIGDLAAARETAGQSSQTHGYASGGSQGSPAVTVNTIEKFPFASSILTVTDVGDLFLAVVFNATQSSTVSGYCSGGTAPPGNTNTIQKFPFATDSNGTDVGDLSQIRRICAGQQI